MKADNDIEDSAGTHVASFPFQKFILSKLRHIAETIDQSFANRSKHFARSIRFH